MKYRVRLDLIFIDKSDALILINWLKTNNAIKKVVNIAEEKSFFSFEECHHDESPPGKCVTLQYIEK